MSSKKGNKPIKDLHKFGDLETIESGPTKEPSDFIPEENMTYDQLNEGGNKHGRRNN